MFLVITFWLADTNKPDFSTNILLRSYQKRLKFFVIFPNNLILVPSYMQKVMANNNCDLYPYLIRIADDCVFEIHCFGTWGFILYRMIIV